MICLPAHRPHRIHDLWSDNAPCRAASLSTVGLVLESHEQWHWSPLRFKAQAFSAVVEHPIQSPQLVRTPSVEVSVSELVRPWQWLPIEEAIRSHDQNELVNAEEIRDVTGTHFEADDNDWARTGSETPFKVIWRIRVEMLFQVRNDLALFERE